MTGVLVTDIFIYNTSLKSWNGNSAFCIEFCVSLLIWILNIPVCLLHSNTHKRILIFCYYRLYCYLKCQNTWEWQQVQTLCSGTVTFRLELFLYIMLSCHVQYILETFILFISLFAVFSPSRVFLRPSAPTTTSNSKLATGWSAGWIAALHPSPEIWK